MIFPRDPTIYYDVYFSKGKGQDFCIGNIVYKQLVDEKMYSFHSTKCRFKRAKMSRDIVQTLKKLYDARFYEGPYTTTSDVSSSAKHNVQEWKELKCVTVYQFTTGQGGIGEQGNADYYYRGQRAEGREYNKEDSYDNAKDFHISSFSNFSIDINQAINAEDDFHISSKNISLYQFTENNTPPCNNAFTTKLKSCAV